MSVMRVDGAVSMYFKLLPADKQRIAEEARQQTESPVIVNSNVTGLAIVIHHLFRGGLPSGWGRNMRLK